MLSHDAILCLEGATQSLGVSGAAGLLASLSGGTLRQRTTQGASEDAQCVIPVLLVCNLHMQGAFSAFILVSLSIYVLFYAPVFLYI